MQNNKNFQEVLVAFINGLDLELTARLDYFKADGDDLVVNLLPTGRKEREFMDGGAEVSLPFEFACKSLDNEKASAILWKICEELSEVEDLPSTDGSYNFIRLNVGREGFAGKDEQAYYVHTLNITAYIETKPRRK
jgi:minor capsid protein|nr:MAG TPA: Minor capsid protein [Caudoviricetes sp.]